MKKPRYTALFAALGLSLISGAAVLGFGPSDQEFLSVDYTPIVQADWQVSTPEAEGLDPAAVTELYSNAAQLETIYGLLVVRNGRLVAEDYWRGSSPSHDSGLKSVTKSFVGALVGVAVE